MRPRVSSAAAKALADKPVGTYRGYDLSWDEKSVLIYDDTAGADALAKELGTDAKHSNARHPEKSRWQSFSLVRLPG